MATIEELQAQLAALTAQVDAITAPPETYYTMQYQGETIDAILTDLLPALPGGSGLPVNQGGTGANTPHLALANLGGRPNRNILDNWYFVGGGIQDGYGVFPVNQKSEKNYSGKGYSIDRWFNEFSGDTTINVLSDGILFSTKKQFSNFAQRVDLSMFEGQKMKLSFLLSDVSPGMYLQAYQSGNPNAAVQVPAVNGISTLSFVVVPNSGITTVQVQFRDSDSADYQTVKIYAAKLEIGDKQTLAYQDSDGDWNLLDTPYYGEELARCQRQLYIPATGTVSTFYAASVNPTSGDIFFPVIVPVQMRTVPVLTVSQCTLYVGAEDKAITPSSVTCYALRGNQALCRANGVAIGASARTGIVEIGGLQLSAEL